MCKILRIKFILTSGFPKKQNEAAKLNVIHGGSYSDISDLYVMVGIQLNTNSAKNYCHTIQSMFNIGMMCRYNIYVLEHYVPIGNNIQS